MLEKSASEALRIQTSRRGESNYGVVISSTENNKINTKLRILFYPQGKIEEVAKSRLDFAIAPTDINSASHKFLDTYNERIRTA